MSWTQQQVALTRELLLAHHQSACRGNISHQALVLAASGSGSYMQSLIAALSTLGGMHAPLARTFEFLEQDQPSLTAETWIENHALVPGWGNSFAKDGPDPLWDRVDTSLREWFPDMSKRIQDVTSLLHSHGKRIYPNPSAYTASAGIILGYNKESVGVLFVQGRLLAWSNAFNEAMQ